MALLENWRSVVQVLRRTHATNFAGWCCTSDPSGSHRAAPISMGRHLQVPASGLHRDRPCPRPLGPRLLRSYSRAGYAFAALTAAARLPSLRPRDVYAQPTGVALYRDGPRLAAHRAVLDQVARGIRVDVEIDPLSTVGASNAGGVLHASILARAGRNVTACRGPLRAPRVRWCASCGDLEQQRGQLVRVGDEGQMRGC